MPYCFETIFYQHKDRFVTDLIEQLRKIYDSLRQGTYSTTNQLIDNHPSVKEIEKLTLERFGMTMEISKDLYVLSPAAIVPFFGDYMRGVGTTNFYKSFSSNVKMGDLIRKIESIEKAKIKTLKKSHGKKGYVDLKHARVGGYLSTLRHYLILDFKWMYDAGITEEELAGIMLHEYGHAFDGMEEHYRLEKTNRAILDILLELRDNQEEKALYHFRNTFTESEFKAAQLSTSKERQDFCSELALQYLNTIDSQYLDGKYDETNFENMADSFATRFGVGKHMVSGLQKLHLNGGQVLPRNFFGYAVTSVLYTLSAAVVLLIVPPYGLLGFMALSTLLFGKRNADMTYDLPMDRYTRIKNTIVNALKNTSLPVDVTKDLLEQIEFIDQVICEYMQAPQSLFDVFANWALPANRRTQNYIDLQQSFERNMNNPLFVKSAQLRVL